MEDLGEMIQCFRDVNLFQIDYTICPKVDEIEKALKLTVYRIIQ